MPGRITSDHYAVCGLCSGMEYVGDRPHSADDYSEATKVRRWYDSAALGLICPECLGIPADEALAARGHQPHRR